MRIRTLLSMAGLCVALGSSATAQFSVSGAGSLIPASGTGGDAFTSGDGAAAWDTTQAGLQAASTVSVPTAVSSIDSIQIDGLTHTWTGDLQATLEDPNGVEHLIFSRPGFTGTGFGNAGDFVGGTYLFVESGSLTLPTTGDAAPGTYNQDFGQGITWNSGTNGINNTPMTTIAGPAGNWILNIYDWGAGDVGSFSGWTLNGNGSGGGANSGAAYCFGDATGATCPCSAFGNPGEGCMTTSGSGALLTGTGDADVAADTFVLTVTGGPANKPGIFFQGNNQFNLPAGDGIVCSNSTLRYSVTPLDASGSVVTTNFGVNTSSGSAMNYQFWFRDPGNTCTGSQFNFSNGWAVTWN